MAVSFSLPVLQEEPSGGKLVAVPHGASIPEGATSVPEGLRMPAHVVADATQRARLSGKVRSRQQMTRWSRGDREGGWEGGRDNVVWYILGPEPDCDRFCVPAGSGS